MTREEAISEWTVRRNHIKKWLDENGEEPNMRHDVELIDMAIEALNREWQIIENGYTGKEMRFRMDGKLFAVRELAQ